jgi:hypothetical protein
MTNRHPEQDPAEGSRDTVERQLGEKRSPKQPGQKPSSETAAEKARQDMARWEKEQTELPQKGAP